VTVFNKVAASGLTQRPIRAKGVIAFDDDNVSDHPMKMAIL